MGLRDPQTYHIVPAVYMYVMLCYFSILFGAELPPLDNDLSSLDIVSNNSFSSR